jgi:ribonuclease HI
MCTRVLVVGVTGLEPATSRPPAVRATNCATPRRCVARSARPGLTGIVYTIIVRASPLCAIMVRMKTLKFDHTEAQLVLQGRAVATARLFDEKDLSVGDEVRFIDKVTPAREEAWRVFGRGRVMRIIEKPLRDLSAEDRGALGVENNDDIFTAFAAIYGAVVKNDTVAKIIYFDFTADTKDAVEEPTTDSKDLLLLYTDGGSRGNPGPSASGFVIIDPATEEVLVDKGVYLGVTNNNQAEYLALKYGLEEAGRMKARQVQVFMDSLLVVNQMKGMFKISNRDLWPVHEAIRKLIASFDKVTFTHIPRELNRQADAAVNRALDTHESADTTA